MATANKILNVAYAEIGTKESPANSNNVKYNTWYYNREVSGSSYPWCVVFVMWVFYKAGAFDLVPVRTASCGTLSTWAKQKSQWVRVNYQPGDVIIYDWTNDGVYEHCGIVVSVSSDSVTAIEGNTAIGNDSDGGEVMLRTRRLSSVAGAWRPDYEMEDTMSYDAFKEYMNQYLEERKEMDAGTYSDAVDAVEWATQTGLMKGDQNGNLMMKSWLTREELAIVLKRYEDQKES